MLHFAYRKKTRTPITGDRLLEVDEVASMLSISSSSVWRLRDAGKLLSVRVGHAVRWRLADVLAYIASLQ